MSSDGPQIGNSPYAADGQYGAPTSPAKRSNAPVTIIIVLSVVLVFTLMVCAVFGALLLPAIQAAREAARRTSDSNNMKQIALAMHNHDAAHAGLPLPAVLDSEGQEVLSWRIRLLPYIEQWALYERVDLENPKPWNAPENAFLLEFRPITYASTRAELVPALANVFVIATNPGPPESVQAAFTHGESVSFSDFEDGLSNTILAVMLTQAAVEWTKPSALTPEEAFAAIQNEPLGVTVAMADGSVKFLSKTIDHATFMALCTRNGGERVPAY
ncbi:DUF1559 domain-containing protein [Planctomycetaceae bacterium SH139]